MLLAALALGSLLAGPTAAKAPVGRPAGERSLERFLADLQAASDRNDRRAIAAMIRYPIRIVVSGWIIPVNDRATFIQSFDAFFTEEIKDLIAGAAATPRSGASPEIISLASGALRVMRVDGRFQIIGIVPPPPSRKVRGARRGTTTISLPAGQGTASFSGTLAKGEHESYVVHVARNELLDVRVDRVRGRDIVAHVLDAATRAPIDARGHDGARVWTGRVPAAADYVIDIVREASGAKAVLTYSLTVSVR